MDRISGLWHEARWLDIPERAAKLAEAEREETLYREIDLSEPERLASLGDYSNARRALEEATQMVYEWLTLLQVAVLLLKLLTFPRRTLMHCSS